WLYSVMKGAYDAQRAAGKSRQDVSYLVAGISGAGEPAMRWALQSGLQPKLPNAKICVTSDLVLSLAATGEIPSVVVIAGTGSAVLGRTTPVKLARAGGFGPVIGDPGSAYDTGRKAAAVCAQKHLNNAAFSLGVKILVAFGWKFDEFLDQARA